MYDFAHEPAMRAGGKRMYSQPLVACANSERTSLALTNDSQLLHAGMTIMATPGLIARGASTGLALVCLMATAVEAQMPGVPVLQNAFTNRGLAFAANFGGGGGQSVAGAAAAWGLGGTPDGDGRLSVAAGAAVQHVNDATRGVYGARAAARLWSSSGGALGFGGFAGFGGAPRTRSATAVTNPAVMIVPVGLSASYRRAIGARRGMSLYASPFYRWSRAEADAVVSTGTIRFSAGFDFALSRAFGITIGGEFGGKTNGTNEAGTIGGGFSFIPGRRR
jgi:hypothetical protein